MIQGCAERDAETPGTAMHTPRSYRFPKSARLRKRREFLAVQRAGRRFHGRHFLAVVSAPGADLPAGRAGITVTKKVGHAVTRNRIKRLVREYLRHGEWLRLPMESVIIAKRSASTRSMRYADVAHDLDAILADIRGKSSLGRLARKRGPSTC